MTAIIYAQQERMLEWAAARMGYPRFRFRQDARAIGREKAGELVGVVVFDTWSDGDCLIHVVSDGSRRWFNKEFAIRAMAYPFRQVGNRRMTALVRATNEPSLEMCEHFGFTREGTLRKAGPGGEDMILLGILREECPWIDGRKPAIVRIEA